MALEIFKLVGSIFIDTDKANESMKKTDSNATKMAEGLGKAGKVAAGVGVAIGTAVVGAGTALVGMANDASKTADEIDKMSQKIGMSAEGYQEWSYIMEQNGMDVDKLQTGMKTLVSQMDKVKDGNADAINTFKELGVEVLNADGSMRSQEEVMNDTIRALAEMGNTAERAKLQTELFGKAGTEMAPMLNQGAAAIDDLKQRAHDLGLVMSDEAVKTGVEYGDLSNDLQKSFGMLKTNLGSALFPVLNSVIKKLIEFMPKLQEIGQRLGPIASDFIEKLIPPLAELAGQLLPVLLSAIGDIIPLLADIVSSIVPVMVSLFTELTPILVQIIQDVLPVVANILSMILPLISTILQFLTPILGLVLQLVTPLLQLVTAILTPILGLITAILTPLLQLVSAILTPIISIISALLGPLTQIITMILEPLTGLLDVILEPLISLLEAILPPLLTLLQEGIEWLSPKIEAASEFLTGFFNFLVEELGTNLPKVFQKFSDFIKKFWDGLKGFVKEGINFYIRSINTLLEGLNKIKPPSWLAEKTGIQGVNFSTIPLLAKGGEIVRGGSAIVGEAGPEILNLPTGASVTPLSGGIDYERLTEAFVVALRLVAPELRTVVEGDVDLDRLIKLTVKADREARMSRGKGLYEA